MPTILPVSDLTNYPEVLNQVTEDNPVYLTKHGRGEYVIIKANNMTRQEAEQRLFEELAKGEASGYVSFADTKTEFGL